jgi:hypothetical protein
MLLNDYGGSMDCRGRGSTKVAVKIELRVSFPFLDFPKLRE